MQIHRSWLTVLTVTVLSACLSVAAQDHRTPSRSFEFDPLPASAECVPGGVGTFPNEQPFLVPSGN